jgi:hypothetical protein
LKQRDVSGLKTAEYSLLDCTRNEDILEELKVHKAEKKLAQYKRKSLNSVSRTEDTGDTKTP